MFKKVNNWHLSILVIIVSIFSVALIQEYALAAWQEPSAAPGSIVNQNIVLNPMTSDLDLNDKSLTGDNVTIDPDGTNAISISNSANLCLGGTCKSAWPADSATAIWSEHTGGINYVSSTNPNVGIGTTTPSELLHVDSGNILVSGGNINMATDVSIKGLYGVSYTSILYLDSKTSDLNLAGNNINFKDLSGNSLMYLEDLGSIANLGIGTITPNKSLHIKTPTGVNAEINLESGTNTHWGMYQDETSADLRFWHNDDVVVFNSTGYVGIGTSTPTHQLHVESLSQNAVYGEAQAVGKFGVAGENAAIGGFGVSGIGQYGVIANTNQSGGAGIMAIQGAGDYAGWFLGDVESTANVKAATATITGELTAATATINGDLAVTTGYFQFPVVTSNPPDSECSSVLDRGKAVFNSTSGTLIICNFIKFFPDPWNEYERTVSL